MRSEYERISVPKNNWLDLKKTVLLGIGTLAIGAAVWKPSTNLEAPFVFQKGARCGKIDAVVPEFNKSIEIIFKDPDFRQESLGKFSGALQISTEIQDTNPPPDEDLDYYSQFFKFHAYLVETFPLVHKHLKLEKVNHVGLLYTWQGSDDSLKPMMLTAHQDVVPVNPNTVSDWTFPPYSGHYDNTTDFVWGRGSVDCKNLLIGELEAIEQLLRDGFEPTRSVIVALGFDEESSGILGARHLGEFLYERYGDNGIYSIVDEGGGVMPIGENTFAATPITGEKGYVDVEITIHGVGGHSSAPPDHTTIGVAANLINSIESNPFAPTFTTDNPFYGLLTCVAEHGNLIPDSIKKAILEAPSDSEQRRKMIDFISGTRSLRELLRTSQAIDIINGGVKANALPEVTSFLMNHRIDINSSVNKTVERDVELVKEFAQQFHFGVFFAGKELIAPTELGFIEIEAKKGLEPAPLSPVTNSPVWDLFAGTIQNVFENGHFKEKPETELYVTQALITGNTDTKYYWRLTENIYRFMAMVMSEDTMRTIHSVNEHISMSGHLSTIAFIYEYIVNVNEKS
ncbi:LANO_0G04016g1_1 [Lachancea nothofagi CBS 11611]|uniref:LANO_0G04016g1_1 n=1 Tax=Lachancea nothofagi CBS 11611 TaxID=1266666 RepID=A0A1G4KG58_9SACH|nr:LANO_0G04016g1_1 [Lachancea nothofagi CBS 11611]